MTDREQLLALYGACFPEDDPQFWNWVFDKLYREENTLTVRENGTIVASLQMIPCEMQLEERWFSAHYIYAAATLPTWQGKGLMARLLAKAEEEGRRRGQAFSVLITQEDSLLDYYARFGMKADLKSHSCLPLKHRCLMHIAAAGHRRRIFRRFPICMSRPAGENSVGCVQKPFGMCNWSCLAKVHGCWTNRASLPLMPLPTNGVLSKRWGRRPACLRHRSLPESPGGPFRPKRDVPWAVLSR